MSSERQAGHAPEMLERFEAEFADLDALCADRDLTTSEVFAPNDWYGIATVLKAYAGIPLSRSLKALVPHGIYFNDHHVIEYERRSGLPAAFGYEQHRLPLYAKHGVVGVPFASPFCYANELVRYEGPRRGALYFPAHSTHWLTVDTDWEGLADEAAALDAPDRPLTVVMYWRDFLLGHHLPFAERGLKLVSAGHMFDPDFLLRLAYLLQSHERAFTSALGGHVYYATHAGCPIRIIEHEYGVIGADESFARDVPGLSPERARAWNDIEDAFAVEADGITEAQRAIAAEYLSTGRMLDPDALRSLLEWAERLDRRGALAGSPPAPAECIGRPAAVPFAWRRATGRLELRGREALQQAIARARRALPFLERVRLPKR